MEEMVRNYINFARQLSSNGSYSKSLDFYILAFDKEPEIKPRFELEFRTVLTKLNEILVVSGRIEELFFQFGRAVNIFPTNIYYLNDIGKYLYQFGYYMEAWSYFQKALSLDSGFVNAEKNLNSLKNLLVERWHFRMLNDKTRNEAYHDAIRDTVVPFKDCVLDLGTGTGLLAMYANKCSPSATVGCDGSNVMTKLADCILQENGIQEVVILNKMSTDMDYRDIGGKQSLLVTEMFDAGLFGEHILQTLCHARQHLITNEAKVIPNKAEFFVAGVKCDHLYLKYHLALAPKKLLNIGSMNVHVLANNETYDCEDVYLYKDLKYMTDVHSLLKVDFNDHNNVHQVLTRSRPYNIDFKALEKGEFNIIVGWFNLYLTDNITITTDPRSPSRASAWQQAIFFDNKPEILGKDQTVDAQFKVNAGKLTLLPNFDGFILRVSSDALRFLNDTDYINMITKCIGMACVYLGQMVDISDMSILDLCPFPYFGFLMLKRGARLLTCAAKTDCDKRFLRKVLKVNNIPLSKIKLLPDHWNEAVFNGEMYHAIFSNIFDVCGDVDIRQKDIAQHLKTVNLVQGGLFMPANIDMVGQLVNSQWLDANNRLYDKNVNNYKMAMHVNKYQVSQNFCLDFTCLEYTALTEPTMLGSLSNSKMVSEVINVPVIKDGDVNAILCWYIIELMEGLGEISTNRGNAFIDGTAFLANPQVKIVAGEQANVLRCFDVDGAFKLVIDVEAT